MTRQGRLKLRARDPEDLRVLSACLQDALVPLADIAYLKPEQRFVLVVNRFMWESAPEEAELPGEATHGSVGGVQERLGTAFADVTFDPIGSDAAPGDGTGLEAHNPKSLAPQPVRDDEAREAKEMEERAAADRIFALVPDPIGSELRALWDEYEARDTPEGRFAYSCDRLQPLLHCQNTRRN